MIVAGVDEAGRGALVGDVVAAAVILPTQYDAKRLVDSKTLTENKRQQAADYIKDVAVDFAIGSASSVEIDRLNIHHATLLAMQRAIASLSEHFDAVWVDGKFTPPCDKPITAFVKGDALHACISAASLLAKTTRDAQLRQLDELYPQYGFARHKGYATHAHRQALGRYGVLPTHRRSYKTVRELM